jgi:hypothetical protein
MARNRRVEVLIRYHSGKGTTTSEVYDRIGAQGLTVKGKKPLSPAGTPPAASAPAGTAPGAPSH